MDYFFTCKKCGCHIFMGPIKFDYEGSVVICANCWKSKRCNDAFLRILRRRLFFNFINN